MTKKKIAYLTDFTTTMEISAGDDLLVQALLDDYQVDIIPWEEENISWDEYALTMIRTTWDYMPKTEKYLSTLQAISTKSILINPLETIKWNINKKYLLELKDLGHPIIPTSLHEKITHENFSSIFEQMNNGEGIIIKPTVGASSEGIQKISTKEELQELHTGEWFVQPFQKSIQEKGEYSLFYFNKKYSHAINKLPKAGEFRSQEEFDSHVTKIEPHHSLKELGNNVLNSIPVETHYARVDIILDDQDSPQIVELELIEPCLFFKYVPKAVHNYKQHIDSILKG